MHAMLARANGRQRRTYGRAVLMGMDVVVINLAAFFAVAIGLGGELPAPALVNYLLVAIPYTVSSLLVLRASGLYTQPWQYEIMEEVPSVLKAASISALLFLAWSLLLEAGLPRSTYVLNFILAVTALFGYRVSFRLFSLLASFSGAMTSEKSPTKVLVVGTGSEAQQLLRQRTRREDCGLRVVGLASDTLEQVGALVQGVEVLGTLSSLSHLIQDYQVEEVLLTMSSVPVETMRQLHRTCQEHKVRLRVSPLPHELPEVEMSWEQVRDVGIGDLLCRRSWDKDGERVAAYLRGRAVLLTGAGGSIGAELCRRILQQGPNRLVMVDHDAYRLSALMRELEHWAPRVQLDAVLGDVRDERRMDEVFAHYKPAVAFHAVLLKHSSLVEHHPAEAIKTNVLGALNVARSAQKYGVRKFVLLSTTAASTPQTVVGASARVAERAVLGICGRCFSDGSPTEGTYQQEFVVVRLGNVLGSTGSLVHLCHLQVDQGGLACVADPGTFHFLGLSEAAELVLEAGAVGRGGQVLTLDMGEAESLPDLLEDMARLQGLRPPMDGVGEAGDVLWGDSLHAEGVNPPEELVPTAHARIRELKGTAGLGPDIWLNIRELEDSIWRQSQADPRTLLMDITSSG